MVWRVYVYVYAASVFWQPAPQWPESLSLTSVSAPWHPAGFNALSSYGLVGIKWLSYAANVAATRQAKSGGYDDAVLVSRDGVVLEGPTFAVGWFIDGVFETPCVTRLGLLPSITLELAIRAADRLGFEVRHSSWPIGRVMVADEVCAMSSTKDIRPVHQVDGVAFKRCGPLVMALNDAYMEDAFRRECD